MHDKGGHLLLGLVTQWSAVVLQDPVKDQGSRLLLVGRQRAKSVQLRLEKCVTKFLTEPSAEKACTHNTLFSWSLCGSSGTHDNSLGGSKSLPGSRRALQVSGG